MRVNRTWLTYITILLCVLGLLHTALKADPPANQPGLPQITISTNDAVAEPAKAAPRCVLSGHVLGNNGQLISGATIEIWTLDGTKRNILGHLASPPTSDVDGRFVIADLPAGDFAITATFVKHEKNGRHLAGSGPRGIILTSSHRNYCRLSVPFLATFDPIEKFLHQGDADRTVSWSTWSFPADGIQVAGQHPTNKRQGLDWGYPVDGLQIALVLTPTPGKERDSAAATLIVRNVLHDRMLDFDRYRARENFAFEFARSDGSVHLLKRNLWRFNRLNPEHQMNRIYLRPGDEYELSLGEFDLSSFAQSQMDVGVRARLSFFRSDKGPDRPLREEFSSACRLESGWLSFARNPNQNRPNDFVDGPSEIKLIVLDSQSDRPIPQFVLYAGQEHEPEGKGGADSRVYWRAIDWRQGTGGRVSWPMDEIHGNTRFRVEAEGYRPEVSQIVRPNSRPLVMVMRLIPDQGIWGQVLRPDGKPAHRAQVAVAFQGNNVDVQQGRIVKLNAAALRPANPWHVEDRIETDHFGKFHLPGEILNATIVVAPESGYVELPRAALTPQTPTITLRPWCHLDGVLLWGDKPGTQAEICLTGEHHGAFAIPDYINYHSRTTTDVEGQFSFQRIPSGPATVYHRGGVNPANGQPIPWLDVFPIMDLHINSTGPTTVVLGGLGRPVTGRFRGRSNWTGITVRLVRRPPLLANEEQRNGYRRYRTSVEGIPYHPDEVALQADGTFRIDRVPSADYQLQVRELLKTILFRRKIDVASMPTGTSDIAMDLGGLEMIKSD
ncbi:MAG: polymerase sigma factor, sigma-70 family [Planctomycetaceae bacterium]|nr:polymerase sigma factor, sigma-70 family [Planctomycetaceae bacterium]